MKKRLLRKTALTAALALLFTALVPVAALADPKATWPSFLMGDVDMDGSVSSADARLALRASVSLENFDPCSYAFSAADADRDGSVTPADARTVLRASVGLDQMDKGIRESCDWFTVTVPSSWAGQYTTEKTQDAISFYHKASQDAGSNGFMFRIAAVTEEEAVGSFELSSFCFQLDGTEPRRCVTLDHPGDYQAAPACEDEYNRMASLCEVIAGTLEPAAWYVYPDYADYSELPVNYHGTQGADMPFGLVITETRRNVIEAVVSYTPDETLDPVYISVTMVMFGDSGVVFWNEGNSYCFGSVAVTPDGLLEIVLNGEGDSWTNTDVPITFFPRQGGGDSDGLPMLADQEDFMWDELYGVWAGETERFVLLFTESEEEGRKVMIGPPAASADFVGRIRSPFFVGYDGTVILHTYYPGGYSEETGEYYPDTEDVLYLDATELVEGRLRWSFDRQDWCDCYFFTTDFDRAYELA